METSNKIKCFSVYGALTNSFDLLISFNSFLIGDRVTKLSVHVFLYGTTSDLCEFCWESQLIASSGFIFKTKNTPH